MGRHRRYTHFYHETPEPVPLISFTLRTDAYLSVIHLLNALNEKLSGNTYIQQAIEYVKIQFENHVQSIDDTCHLLENLIRVARLRSDDRQRIRHLIMSIASSQFEQTPEIKFRNVMARHYESVMGITFLLNPTTKMLAAVKTMSDRIIPILDREQYLSKYPKLASQYDKRVRIYMRSIGNKNHTGYCRLGALPDDYKLADVIDMMKNNRPEHLVHIMWFHYAFICFFRALPYALPVCNEPVGEFATVLKAHWKATDNYMDYFGEKGLGNPKSSEHRLFADTYLYKRPIYGDYNRGRGDLLSAVHPAAITKVMGVMLPGDDDNLPLYPYPQLPYCRILQPKFSSPYVKDLIDNDCVYVSGPSGMTTVFLGLMEMIGDFSSVEQRQHYLMAVVAYMVATGHHSIHEILMPAEDGLKLIPGYNVSVPDEKQLAQPPNYYQFYELQNRIDPEFMSRRESAWDRTLSYFCIRNQILLKGELHEKRI